MLLLPMLTKFFLHEFISTLVARFQDLAVPCNCWNCCQLFVKCCSCNMSTQLEIAFFDHCVNIYVNVHTNFNSISKLHGMSGQE